LEQKVAYLRHDIDYSIQLSEKIAQINNQLDISGTFFLMVRNRLYNLCDESCQKSISCLLDQNQRIGLHFELPSFSEQTDLNFQRDIHRRILDDYDLLKRIAGCDIDAVMSWHNPSLLGEKYSKWVEAEVPGLLNAYSLRSAGIEYMADSNLRFSVEEWLARPGSGPKRIQILFHPFQWLWNATSMRTVLAHTWLHIMRREENVFLTNHIYRELLPSGLPDEKLKAVIFSALKTDALVDGK
jgi:hypothetical protein